MLIYQRVIEYYWDNGHSQGWTVKSGWQTAPQVDFQAWFLFWTLQRAVLGFPEKRPQMIPN